MGNILLLDDIIDALWKVCKEFGDTFPLSENRIQERPICYEFYHKFRSSMSAEILPKGIVLTAEPDKRYQKSLSCNVKKQPDFIIHTPNTNENNLAVLEFKKYNNISKIFKDLQKLLNFKKDKDLKYETLVEVIIIYRKMRGDLKKKLKNNIKFQGSGINIIFLDTTDWCVKEPFKL